MEEKDEQKQLAPKHLLKIIKENIEEINLLKEKIIKIW